MTYNNECFSAVPTNSHSGPSEAAIKKTYRYGRYGDMELTTHVNGDVSVYYAPSCVVFHVESGDSQRAWDFASERKQHLRQIGC